MSTTEVNRDALASWYAHEHLKTDSGIESVYFLPENSPDDQIRFVEINILMADRTDHALEPIDFGINMGSANEHRLMVLDVSPEQWKRIVTGQLRLPDNWSVEHATHFCRE